LAIDHASSEQVNKTSTLPTRFAVQGFHNIHDNRQSLCCHALLRQVTYGDESKGGQPSHKEPQELQLGVLAAAAAS
jgi:hypothetical protein